MKIAWLGCVLWGSLLIAGNQQSESNVNSRYIVESVEITGRQDAKISSFLRDDMNHLVGERVDLESIDNLARRIRKELHVTTVTHRLLKGDEFDHVKVVFDLKGRKQDVDVNIPKFVFSSKQGWSAAAEASTTISGNAFTVGMVSDNDALPERYTGVTARYERRSLGTDRVGLRFAFASYHDQWTRASENFVSQQPFDSPDLVPGIYRTRQDFEPALTFILAKPLSLTVGAGFQRFQTQYPNATFQGANAMVASLRFHHQVEDSDANKHDVDATYSLRAATRALGSDFVYMRHAAQARYHFKRGNHDLSDEVIAGYISGQAPIFERFVLGNSSTLRGWNRFDIDPVGGDRVVHNSVDYRYRLFEIFWDAGAIWNRTESPTPRHSLGVGLREGAFFLAVAFPVRNGRADPIFMVGMNY
jgi:outer membrane protein assembly factor BamA